HALAHPSLPTRRSSDLDSAPQCGTTNIDFSPTLFAGVEQMRSYRQTRLSVGKEAVALATTSAVKVLEKQVKVPDSWLRGFLQVRSEEHTSELQSPDHVV